MNTELILPATDADLSACIDDTALTSGNVHLLPVESPPVPEGYYDPDNFTPDDDPTTFYGHDLGHWMVRGGRGRTWWRDYYCGVRPQFTTPGYTGVDLAPTPEGPERYTRGLPDRELHEDRWMFHSMFEVCVRLAIPAVRFRWEQIFEAADAVLVAMNDNYGGRVIADRFMKLEALRPQIEQIDGLRGLPWPDDEE